MSQVDASRSFMSRVDASRNFMSRVDANNNFTSTLLTPTKYPSDAYQVPFRRRPPSRNYMSWVDASRNFMFVQGPRSLGSVWAFLCRGRDQRLYTKMPKQRGWSSALLRHEATIHPEASKYFVSLHREARKHSVFTNSRHARIHHPPRSVEVACALLKVKVLETVPHCQAQVRFPRRCPARARYTPRGRTSRPWQAPLCPSLSPSLSLCLLSPPHSLSPPSPPLAPSLSPPFHFGFGISSIH